MVRTIRALEALCALAGGVVAGTLWLGLVAPFLALWAVLRLFKEDKDDN